MNCSSFERWLDAGMPESGASRALAHAEGCKVCAPALAEARAVEAALRAEARVDAVTPSHAPADRGSASVGFVDAVMARVEAEAAATRRVGDSTRPAEERPAPWWFRLFADPVSAVSVTLAIVVGAVAAVHPEWIAAGAAAILAIGQRASNGLTGWQALSRPSPATFALAAAIAPVLVLVAVAAYRSFERALVLMAGSRRP